MTKISDEKFYCDICPAHRLANKGFSIFVNQQYTTMSFGGPYSELNKRMRESREESKRRRERRNKFKESAGIQSASSDINPFERKFSEKDKQAFLQELKAERFNEMMKLQQKISNEVNRSFMGKTVDVLIDEKSEGEKDKFVGRTQADAPEVDGCVYVSGEGVRVGEFCKVKITDTLEYDLVGKAI